MKALFSSFSAILVFLLCSLSGSYAQSSLAFQGQLPYTQSINDIWGYADGNGNEYALVGTQTGTSIVDVTNPTNPTELHFIPGTSSTWRDLKTWGTYAYVTTEANDQLLIIDLSGLPGSVSHSYADMGIGFLSAHNIYIDENGVGYLFGTNLSNADGAVMIDIAANPTNPVHLGNYDTYYIHDGFVRDDVMWGSHIYAGHFGAIDVSNKSNPVVMATQSTDKVFTHACWLSDDSQTLFTLDEKSDAPLQAWDVSDLNDIQELDRYKVNPGTNVIPHNVFVKGNFVVISYYTAGVVILDATHPYNLIEVANYDTSPATGSGFTGCWGTYPYLPSGNILATDRQEGLFVLAGDCQQAAYLEGTITDIFTGSPIPNATVDITGLPTSSQGTDLFGFYATGSGVGGTYTVTVSAPGYNPETVTVTLVNGVITIEDVALTPFCDFPTNQKVTNISDNTALLSWDVMIGAVSYTVYYRELPSGTWMSITTSSNFYTANNLNPSTDYEFYVETTCNSLTSPTPSSTIPFTTLPQCDPPLSFNLTSVTASSAVINWSGDVGATSYTFLYRIVGTSIWNSLTTTSATVTLNPLQACTDYEYVVEGTCNVGQSSGLTNINTFTTANPMATWVVPANSIFECSNPIDLSSTITGATGGQWSGGNISSTGVLDPSNLSVGTYNITYTIVGGNCTIAETHPINILATPDATWTTNSFFSCDAPIDLNTLVTGSTGGTWSGGSYVTANGLFDPASAGNGVYAITYSVGTPSNGCSDTQTENLTINPCTELRLKVLLEGAYDPVQGQMRTDLQNNGLLSPTQPYNVAPWNYNGTETISSFPIDMVDWVLLELRDANNMQSIVAQTAAILLQDGTVVAVDGSSDIPFINVIPDDYYIVVRHRNHLDVVSATAITLPNITAYDFSTNITQAYGPNQMKTRNGVAILYSGDNDANGVITVADFNVYANDPAQVNVYINSDTNLDGNVSTTDFNLYQPNKSIIGIQQIRY